jgi:hypothetical protein
MWFYTRYKPRRLRDETQPSSSPEGERFNNSKGNIKLNSQIPLMEYQTHLMCGLFRKQTANALKFVFNMKFLPLQSKQFR